MESSYQLYEKGQGHNDTFWPVRRPVSITFSASEHWPEIVERLFEALSKTPNPNVQYLVRNVDGGGIALVEAVEKKPVVNPFTFKVV